MSIRERIFIRLEELQMTQKEFSEKTGISQSAISEWKSKKTNPAADKIMIICQILKVSPEWLLSGTDKEGGRGNSPDFLVVDKNTEVGGLLMGYNKLSRDARARLLGYYYALSSMGKDTFDYEKMKKIMEEASKETD